MHWSLLLIAASLHCSSAIPLPQSSDPSIHGPYRMIAETVPENSPLNNQRVAVFDKGVIGISPVRSSFVFNLSPDHHHLVSLEGNQYLNLAQDDEVVLTDHADTSFVVRYGALTVDGRAGAVACPVTHISSLMPGDREEESQGHLVYWPKNLDSFRCPRGESTKVTLRLVQVRQTPPHPPGIIPPQSEQPGGMAPVPPAPSHHPPPLPGPDGPPTVYPHPGGMPPMHKKAKREEDEAVKPWEPATDAERWQPDRWDPEDKPWERPCDRPDRPWNPEDHSCDDDDNNRPWNPEDHHCDDRPWDDDKPWNPEDHSCDRPDDRPWNPEDPRPWDYVPDRPWNPEDPRPWDDMPDRPWNPERPRPTREPESWRDGDGENLVKVTPYTPVKKAAIVEVSPKPNQLDNKQISVTYDPVTVTLTQPWLRPSHTSGGLEPLPPITILTFTPGVGQVPPTPHPASPKPPVATRPPHEPPAIAPAPPQTANAARENKSPETMTINGEVYQKIHEPENTAPKALPRLTLKKRSANPTNRRTLRAGKMIVVESNRPSEAIRSNDTATIETSKKGNNAVWTYTSFTVPETNSTIKSCQLGFVSDHERYPAHHAGAAKFNVYEVGNAKPIDENLTFSKAPTGTKLLATYDNGDFSTKANANCSPGKTVNVLLAPAGDEDSTVGWYRSGDDKSNGLVLDIEYK